MSVGRMRCVTCACMRAVLCYMCTLCCVRALFLCACVCMCALMCLCMRLAGTCQSMLEQGASSRGPLVD